MKDYNWSTDRDHFNNMVTMNDWLENHMPEDWEVLTVDGTYAEIRTPDGKEFEVHAAGNGDSFNHVVSFVEIETVNEAK